MPSLEREVMRLRSLIDDADAIIVGIGSGMSSAAGFNHYNRAGMTRAGMEDWQQAFGFKSLFDGFYYLYPSLEQQWAYYARYIDFMLREPASQPYLDLRSLIGHKDYYILSTNVDAQVEKTFPAERICNYQGSFAYLQCKQPCCDELFDASPYVERMLAGMAGFEIRSEDVPRCPHCGWQLVPWVRDDTFLQGAAWRESLGRYERFVRERSDCRVLLLELGVGEMTPGIITLPFWSMTSKLPDAHLLSVNISGDSAPLQLGSKAEAIQADLSTLLSAARTGDEQRVLILVMQIERSPVDLGAASDVRHRHLREADLGQQREERLLYDREGVAPPAVDLGFSHRLPNLSRLTMSSSCSFIDRCTRLFIAPAKINKDTVYRHLFIIVEREHG